MKVLLEARARGGGIQRYVDNLIRSLRHLPEVDLTTLRTTASGASPGRNTVVMPLRHDLLLPWWLHHQVPRIITRQKPEVVHFTKAAVPQQKQVPTVVTIYDVIPILLPETQRWDRRRYWPRTLRHAADVSDHIITISQASKRDICEHLAVDPNRVTVTPLAIQPQQFTPAPAPAIATTTGQHAITQPYVLFVGTRDPRKNVAALVEAFARLASDVPHQLVIAGPPALQDDGAAAAVQKHQLAGRVRFIGQVPEADLAGLYSGADLFVWPSWYEGWGFPPQEAMACGTPVLVSNGGSLPEVVGGAGAVVQFTAASLNERRNDAGFVQRLAQRMGELLHDSKQRQAMSQAGLAHVQTFSWQSVAQQTLDVYRRVIAL